MSLNTVNYHICKNSLIYNKNDNIGCFKVLEIVELITLNHTDL